MIDCNRLNFLNGDEDLYLIEQLRARLLEIICGVVSPGVRKSPIPDSNHRRYQDGSLSCTQSATP